MPPNTDEVDDVLYLARVNEQEELLNYVSELAQKYSSDTRKILETCVDSESGNTILHFCAANGLTTLAQKILETTNARNSPLLNASNSSGNTPLHWAALNGQLETAKVLVDAGANIWTRNQAGNLAIYEAERATKDDVVQYLLQVGGTEKEKEDANGQPAQDEAAADEDGGAEITMTAGSLDGNDSVESAQEKMQETPLNG